VPSLSWPVSAQGAGICPFHEPLTSLSFCVSVRVPVMAPRVQLLPLSVVPLAPSVVTVQEPANDAA
jgi:hypothetical protein